MKTNWLTIFPICKNVIQTIINLHHQRFQTNFARKFIF